ncbi:Fructosamine/Ketosamine-3-kinase [Syncephalis fuscata]|nr:Fructosamine/Ketosamine-3-kinase [Syncephalis fuscata]
MKPISCIVKALLQNKHCATVYKASVVSGGDTSATSCYQTDQGPFFVKVHYGDKALQMFQAEYLSLSLINKVVEGFAPQPILYGELDSSDKGAFLVTEYVQMSGKKDAAAQRNLAQHLAQLHKCDKISSVNRDDPLIAKAIGSSWNDDCQSNDKPCYYGFLCTTYCGATPQSNDPCIDNWTSFWQNQRLLPLFKTLSHDQELFQLGEELLEIVPQIIGDNTLIKPSLIHGIYGPVIGVYEPIQVKQYL